MADAPATANPAAAAAPEAAPRKKPFITANKVTFVRLGIMPLVMWFIYREQYWTALGIGTLIGCTDFVDGYLARKHGPTVLGGLMDPIADKVFIAFTYLPFVDTGFVDMGMFPAWAVALIFTRDFLVTALRTSYEIRDLRMKTSYLAKVKTWVQMQGIGMIMFFVLLHQDHRTALWAVLIAGAVAPLPAMLALYLIKKKVWKGAIVMSLMQAPLLWLHYNNDLELTVLSLLYVVVGITWLSGFDYMFVGLRQLRGRGDFSRSDAARLLGAFVLPAAMFAALHETGAGWAISMLLAFELALGGLDNLLAHHKTAGSGGSWALRVFGASALLAGAWYAGYRGEVDIGHGLAWGAVAVSVAGTAREFWRGREVYMAPKSADSDFELDE